LFDNIGRVIIAGKNFQLRDALPIIVKLYQHAVEVRLSLGAVIGDISKSLMIGWDILRRV
jgi:hypothetical protein